VGLDDSDDVDAAMRGLFEVLLDRVGRIDHSCDAGVLVADEVRGTTQVVVDELREDHSARDGTTVSRYFS
jgi:hypothetical protein